MAYILCIETATEVCSVALSYDGKVVALEENREGNAHASHITLLIDVVMTKAGVELKQLHAVAVSKGPGSYTGLRVGVSTAKGLCYALDIPLVAINTLQSLCRNFLTSNVKHQTTNFLLCPMLDARRMEVYCALFDEQMKEVKKTEARIIDENSFADVLNESNIHFFGTGMVKCNSVITHPNAIFHHEINCSASSMSDLAEKAYVHKQFEDIAYFEPFYLKDFARKK